MDYGPKDCQQLFDNSDEFCFSHRDSYTGYRHEYPLSEWIESLTKTKKKKKKKCLKKIILNHVTNFFFFEDFPVLSNHIWVNLLHDLRTEVFIMNNIII